jgi:tetratricopeptide (TPR) repeat protein
LLARSVGHRGAGTSLTGSGASIRERKAECLTTSFQEPAEGIECYDRILDEQPDDVEALTYQGWAMVRSDRVDDGSANFDRVVELDPTYPDVHVFRASVLNTAGDPAGAQAELDALYALDPPAGILSTLESMGLDREVAYQLLDPAVQPCWDKVEQAASLGTGADDRAEAASLFTEGITCVTGVVAANPDLVDALEMQGYLLGSSGEPELMAQAGGALDRAIALAPTDPTPLLLRAALRNVSDDFQGALADLDALDALDGSARPSALYVLASPAAIRADVERSLSSTSTTSTP